LRRDDDSDSSEDEDESTDDVGPQLSILPKKDLEIKGPKREGDDDVDDLEWVRVGKTRYRVSINITNLSLLTLTIQAGRYSHDKA
jgi:hypothetical protein